MIDALTLLGTRRTVSSIAIGEPGPTDEQIHTLITIAARVPDHGKLAPWRFILYRGAASATAGEKLADLFKAKNPQADADRIAFETTRFSRVPVVIGVVSKAAAHPKIPEWEQVLSAGAATMNLLIGAHAMGFAAQWLTDWCTYDADATKLLGLGEGERFVGFVSIGTPLAPPTERPRPAVEDILTEWRG